MSTKRQRTSGAAFGAAACVALALCLSRPAEVRAQWTTDTTTHTTATTDKVGVGTAAPAAALDVFYNNNYFAFGVNIRNTNTGPLALAGYGIDNAGGTRVGQFVYVSPSYTVASLRDTVLFASAGATSKLGLVSSADGTGNPDIYIRAGGNRPDSIYVQGATGGVGIGTSSPAAGYRLDVGGSANVAGSVNVTQNIRVGGDITGATITATFQDVAEWVPSVQKLPAGTVVVLDSARTNHVLASTTV